MSKRELVQRQRNEVMAIARRHGGLSLKLFGSTARGDEVEDSDVDFLVEMEPGRSLLDLGGMQNELELFLGCPVDVVTANGLRERIRSQVLTESVPV